MIEKTDLLNSKNRLTEELHTLFKETEITKDRLANETLKVNDAMQLKEKAIQDVNSLILDGNTKAQLIANLEHNSESLKERLFETGEKLENANNSLRLTTLKNEKLLLTLKSTEEKNEDLQEKQIHMQTLKNEKLLIEESYEKLQSLYSESNAKSERANEELIRIKNEDLITLQLECKAADDKAGELSEQLLKAEELQANLQKEIHRLNRQLNEEQIEKDKLHMEQGVLISLKEKNDIYVESLKSENVTSANNVSRAKLENELLCTQLHDATNENNKLLANAETLNTQISEIKSKLGEAEAGFKKILNMTKNENMEVIQQLQIELETVKKANSSKISENEDLVKRLNYATIQLRSTKLLLEEETLKFQEISTKYETNIEELKSQHHKSLQQMKRELEDSEDCRIKELDDCKRNLEKQHKAEYAKLSKEKTNLVDELCNERDKLITELAHHKKLQTAQIMNAEDNNQHALLLAQQELAILKEEKLNLANQIETVTREKDLSKIESLSKGDANRSQITDLQLGNSRMQFQIDTIKQKHEFENRQLTEAHSNEKMQREHFEKEVNRLKQSIDDTNKKYILACEELEDAKSKLKELGMNGRSTISHRLENAEKKLLEADLVLDQVKKSKSDLINQNHLLELEKIDHLGRIKTLENDTLLLENHLKIKNTELLQTKEDFSELKDEHEQVKTLVTSQRNELLTLKNDYQILIDKHNEILTKHASEDYSDTRRDSKNRLQLNSKMIELEQEKISFEKELASAALVLSTEQKKHEDYIQIIQKELDETHQKEKNWEIHMQETEALIKESREEGQKLKCKIAMMENRNEQLLVTIDQKNSDINQIESKFASITNVLKQARASAFYPRSTIYAKSEVDLSDTASVHSPDKSSETSNHLKPAHIDYDDIVSNVKTHIQRLLTKISSCDKEAEEWRQHSSTIKAQNEELHISTVSLEEQLSRAKIKIKGSEDQQRKLEKKISAGDVTIATQDETLRRQELEIRQLSRKLNSTSCQLEDTEQVQLSAVEEANKCKEYKLKLETENKSLKELLEDSKSNNSHYKVELKSSKEEQKRLQLALEEKERCIKDQRLKCKDLMRDITSLEQKCSILNGTVDTLHNQLDSINSFEKSRQTEAVTVNQSYIGKTEQKDASIHLKGMIESLQSEKDVTEQKLRTWKAKAEKLQKEKETADEALQNLKNELQKAESRDNSTKSRLETMKAALESKHQDETVLMEMTQIKKENDALNDKLRVALKQISAIESEKLELEHKVHNQRKKITKTTEHMMNQVHHVRAQIPLVASDNNLDRTGFEIGNHLHHHNLLKIKFAEQETERQRKKVHAIEEQLACLQETQGERIKELLEERRKEKEKEYRKHKVELDRCRESLTAREQIYRERITGLEDQVEMLRTQLGKEMKRRQHFISDSNGINQDISYLRKNLDKSLQNVSHGVVRSTTSRELGKTLDQETNKLQQLSQQYNGGSDSPPTRVGYNNQLDIHQMDEESELRAKRVLSFENIKS